MALQTLLRSTALLSATCRLGIAVADLTASAKRPYCCQAWALDKDPCGSCFPDGAAETGYCAADESSCSGCGGSWCTGRELDAVDTSGMLRGIGYSPSPLLHFGTLPKDDFFSDAAKAQWGPRGRGDLDVIRALGASSVRLYGNDPLEDHGDFLDRAHRVGLGVIPGISDWPYVQSPGSCKNATDYYNCHDQVREAYLANLERGFLVEGKRYHPALEYVIAINEPDLKMMGNDGLAFVRGCATALDGMLSAEAVAGVVGPRPNFTVTFSFAKCEDCKEHGDEPSIGQMLMLRDAMYHPKKYGIKAKHDLKNFYATRFTNSFNTANAALEIPKLFLNLYEELFPHTPVFIAEYHNPNHPNKEQDLKQIMRIASTSPVLLGISFFEFQVRYDEGGHLDFGIFEPEDVKETGASLAGPGSYDQKDFEFFGPTYRIPCLKKIKDESSGRAIADMIAAAFGGDSVESESLCTPNPRKELTDYLGYDRLSETSDSTSMRTYIGRVVENMGGVVPKGVPNGFANKYSKRGATFESLVSALKQHPKWARWSPLAACVVDRDARKDRVRDMLDSVCQEVSFNCTTDVPDSCTDNIWNEASYIFGAYYTSLVKMDDEPRNPLYDCHFHGAARFAAPETYAGDGLRKACVVA